MKRSLYFLLTLASLHLLTLSPATSAPPGLLNHQGRIAVGGVNFDGTGHFKFALVDGAGTTSFWSNDGASAGGGEPTASITVVVNKGHYAVALGETGAIPASVFADNDDVRLRVWFSQTGVLGSFEMLTPDQRITSAGFALSAATAESAKSLGGRSADELIQSARTNSWRAGPPASTSLNFLATVKDTDPGIDGLDGARSVAVAGDHAFVASSIDDALAVFEVSDPAKPTFLAAIRDSDPGVDGLDGAQSVAVSSGLAFVASFEDDALAAIDVSDPANPTFLAAIRDSDPGVDGLDGACSIAVSEGVAFVASSIDDALAVIDVSDPANPAFIAALRSSDAGVDGLDGAQSVSVSGGHAFVASPADGKVSVIDVSDPATPTFLTSIHSSDPGFFGLGVPQSVTVSGGIAYVCSRSFLGLAPDPLVLIDVSTPANPTFLASIAGVQALSNPHSVAVSDGLAFVAAANALVMIDVSNPSNPMFLDAIESSDPGADGLAGAHGVTVVRDLAFVASTNDDALTVIDLARPLSTTGAVGIGTSLPDSELHVEGDAFVSGSLLDSGQSAGESGQVLTSTASGTSWADLDLERFLRDDGSEPVAGNLTIQGIATATEHRFPTPKTFAYNIPANTMQVRSDLEEIVRLDSGGVHPRGSTTTFTVLAPLHLPQGANITSATVRWFDNDPTEKFLDFDGRIKRRPLTNSSAENVAVMAESSPANSADTALHDLPATLTAGKTLIDNRTYTYWVYLTCDVSAADSNLRIFGLDLEYTLQTLNP